MIPINLQNRKRLTVLRNELILARGEGCGVLKVRVCEIDDHGKVKVSHREFIEKPAGYVEKPVGKKPNKHHK